MSEDKKVLKVNPLDFTFNKSPSKNNHTQKRQPKQKTSEIKIKAASKPKKSDTLKKRSILRMIRNQQQNRYDNLFDKKKTNPPVENSEAPRKNNFEEAQNYLNSLKEKRETQHKLKHNSTLRRNIHDDMETMVHANIQKQPDTVAPQIVNLNSNDENNTIPKYGCLKNGNLPTYRNYVNKTSSNRPSLSIEESISDNKGASPIENNVTDYQHSPHKDIQERANQYQMKQFIQKMNNDKPIKIKKRKQKKTIKRHHKVGRSKYYSKIGVLVSNRTIRNNINNQTQQLKTVSIQDIRKYLITNGFIKIGSTAPNDVLRKMYESAILMCGEIKNHSTENLLYNFFNEKKDEL
jgi:hypothetical protein